jgi:hypothetical protein
MEIDTALLCEAATVRDGLFFILGGAITEVVNAEYPAELGLTLALRILVHPTEMEHPHRLEIVLQDEDGEQITTVNGDIQLGGADLVPAGELGEILIPWSFPGKPLLPAIGRYSFELLIDGLHQRSIPLRASAFETAEAAD